MQTLIDYFKSKVGVAKICAVIFLALLVALACYSHFNSHWAYHLSESRNGLLKDYEVCSGYSSGIGSSASSRSSSETMFIIEEGRSTNHLITASQPAGTGGDKPTCPDPALEIVLVAVSISVFLLSLIFLLLICRLKKPINHGIWCQLKIFDMVFYGLSALFLLIGGILFIVSAYLIATWCESYLPTVPGNAQSRSHNDIAVIKTEALENGRSGKDKGGNDDGNDDDDDNKPSNIGDGGRDFHDSGRIPAVRYLVPSVRNKRSIVSGNVGPRSLNEDYIEFCKKRNLTTEKFISGVVALIVALLFATIVVLIHLYCKQNAVVCSEASNCQTYNKCQSQQTETDETSSRKKCRLGNKCEGETMSDRNENNVKTPRRSKDLVDSGSQGGKIRKDTGV